jgi:hypothetical protein
LRHLLSGKGGQAGGKRNFLELIRRFSQKTLFHITKINISPGIINPALIF